MTCVVGVVRTDVSDRRSPLLHFLIGSALHQVFQIGQYPVEPLDGELPGFRVEAVKRLIVIAVEGSRLLALQFGELLRIPKEQVIGKLARGVITS